MHTPFLSSLPPKVFVLYPPPSYSLLTIEEGGGFRLHTQTNTQTHQSQQPQQNNTILKMFMFAGLFLLVGLFFSYMLTTKRHKSASVNE